MSRRIKRRKSQQFRERRRRFNAAREELRSLIQAEILKLLRDEGEPLLYNAETECRVSAAIARCLPAPGYAIDIDAARRVTVRYVDSAVGVWWSIFVTQVLEN